MTGSLLDLSNYFYTFSAWPPFIVGACSLLLGLIILIRERGSYASRTFAALCVCVSLWLLSIGILYSARDAGLALWISRLGTAAVTFIPSTLLAFTIVVVRQFDRWKWLARLSLVMSGLMSVAVFCDNRVLIGLRIFPWGPYPYYGPIAYVFVAFFVSLYVASLVLLSRKTFGESLFDISQDRDRQIWIAFCVGFLAIVDGGACAGAQISIPSAISPSTRAC